MVKRTTVRDRNPYRRSKIMLIQIGLLYLDQAILEAHILCIFWSEQPEIFHKTQYHQQ